MPVKPFKLSIHLVSSLDGMIARKDNDVSWFETRERYEPGRSLSDDEVSTFLENIDCYVMGANTYAQAVTLSREFGWPYREKPVIVLTHHPLKPDRPGVSFYAGDLNELMDSRLKPHYSEVWVAGGAAVAREFIRLKLADELRLSILPVILGDGIPLFERPGDTQELQLDNVTAYKNAMVELVYRLKR